MSPPLHPPRSLVFLSVVPSPYQRDVFAALARRNAVPLRVHYLEHAAPDSPWPTAALESWETVLPGVTLGRRRWRSHFNWRVPRPQPGEAWVVNGAMTDVTTQRFMRQLGHRVPWAFWGELPSTPSNGFRRWLQRRQYAPLARARAIVAVGEKARAAYAGMFPALPVFNQPYACALDAFVAASAPRPARAEPVFLFCGQMIPRKGIDVLLDAFAQLVRAGAPGRLQLIGREAGLPALLARLDAATRARVEYGGFQPPDALPRWFAAADALVLPSRHDGWGVVVNQAFGARLPVICSDAVGAGHDLVQDGVNGLRVPAGDVPALAAALRHLAESPELRARLAAATEATVDRLRPERAAQFWEELATTVLLPS